MEISPIKKRLIKLSKKGRGIYLTDEVKILGDENSPIYVTPIDGKILVTKENDIFEIIRPVFVDKTLWEDFLYVVLKIHGNKDISTIGKCLSDAIHNWIVDQREVQHKLFGFPIYKQKRF